MHEVICYKKSHDRSFYFETDHPIIGLGRCATSVSQTPYFEEHLILTDMFKDNGRETERKCCHFDVLGSLELFSGIQNIW